MGNKRQEFLFIKCLLILIFIIFTSSGYSYSIRFLQYQKECFFSIDSNILSEKKEYQTKARFIFRFIHYVDWGDSLNFGRFNIVILGNSPIVDELKIEALKKGDKKDISVNVVNTISKIKKCQILFISKESEVSLEDIVSKFSYKPVLIVSEQSGYAENGSHINFFISDGKVKFEVNTEALKRAGLKVSSQLLKHAVIVG